MAGLRTDKNPVYLDSYRKNAPWQHPKTLYESNLSDTPFPGHGLWVESCIGVRINTYTLLTLHSPVMACGMSRSLGFEFIHICIYIIQFGRNVPAPRQNKNRGYQCTKKKVSMKAFVYDDVRLYTPMDYMMVAEA